MGSDSSSGASGAKGANGQAATAIFGMLAFGIVSMLFGLSQLPGPHGTPFDTAVLFPPLIWVTGGTVALSMLTLGGVALFLVGLVMMFKGHDAYWTVAFTGYGAFWIIWSTVSASASAHAATGYGTAGVAFVWLLFTLTFLISSFKHGWMTFLFYLALAISFLLLVVEYWQWGGGPTTTISGYELGAIGGFWIFTGFIAWYAATARLTEMNWGRKLPLT